VAAALSNDETVSLQTADANAALAKGNVKLTQTNAATSPPSLCFSPKQTPAACAAVAELDVAHDHGLAALFNVDAIETGGGADSDARRFGRVAWTAAANEELFGIISPDYAGIISPDYAGIIGPELAAGIIGPELADELDVVAGIIGPELPGIISPDRTAQVVGIIGPEYVGISAAERDAMLAEAARIADRAEADLVLAYGLKRALKQQ
jgi:hypothetical protein